MEPLSFFGRFVQKVIVSCFSDSFVQKTTQRSDCSCNVRSDSQLLYKSIKNRLFISANTYEKYISSKEYCIARRNDKMCFLLNCRYHIILKGNIKDLQQKLNAFCFNYEHVDCLYTLFKYRVRGKIVVKSGQLFDNLRRPVDFNKQNRGVDRMRSIAKKRLSRKKYKKRLLSCFQKTKSTQTNGSMFADRIVQVKKTKLELEW